MEKIYHHYHKWEDYHNGLYDLLPEDEQLINYAVVLLKNGKKLHIAMNTVSREWKYSTDCNLSNKSRNRQAWLGQAACCYTYGVPENLTKLAWRRLTKEEQEKANKIADKVICNWEKIARFKDNAQKTIKYFCTTSV